MRRIFIILLALSAGLTACDRRGTDPLGPSLEEIFGEFLIQEPLSVSDKSAEFANGGSIHFSAKFSTLEDWKITIRGLQTGSSKVIEGFSSTIDESNARWIGDVTELPVLKTEMCEVMLTFKSEADTMKDTLEIVSIKTNEGVLITDFENGIDPNWPFFYQSGVTFFADNGMPAGQGSWFLNCQGTVSWDFLIGLIEFPAEFTVGETHFPLSNDATEVYFNVMVFGNSERPNSFMLFRIREDDNGDGTWDGVNEDMYVTEEIFVTWDGWQLISIPYSDLLVAASGDGANGNMDHEPHRSLSVEYLLLSDPTQGATRGDIDYLIFTEGGPLRP